MFGKAEGGKKSKESLGTKKGDFSGSKSNKSGLRRNSRNHERGGGENQG